MKSVLSAVVAMLLCANFAFAQVATNVDIGIGNTNANTNTNNNSAIGTATSNQTQGQQQGQIQGQNQTTLTPTQLMNSQYGTNFVNPGLGIQNKGWELYHSAVYSFLTSTEVGMMKRESRFSDLFSKSRIKVQRVNERISGKPAGISLMAYWPKDVVNPGDKVIISLTVKGEADWPEESFIGLAADACIEQAGSDRFAVLFTTDYNGVTNGSSVSLGGATSSVFSSGTKGAVVTAGGQIGTIETSVEEHNAFKVLCMNSGLLNYYPTNTPVAQTVPTQTTVTEKPVPVQTIPTPVTPAPEQKIEPRQPVVPAETKPAPALVAPVSAVVTQPVSCDTGKIWREINELEQEMQKCTRYCYNNLTLRAPSGEHYIDLYVCTGDKNYLREAIYQFEVAERNFLNGHDISVHQREASQVIAQVYYNWAGCINILYGQESAMTFAHAKKLERIPLGFAR